MILRQDLEKMLTEIEKKQKSVNLELSVYPTGHLTQEMRKGHLVYVHTLKDGERRIRKTITNQPEKMKVLARKKYLETELLVLEENRLVIQKALARVSDITAGAILSGLPKSYAKIPQDYFFSDPVSCDFADQWMQEPYKQSDYKPERKTHLTSRGLAVRSKSEVLIAEKLYEYQVPFRYEQVLTIGKYNLSPDFTLKSRSSEIFYWEHCGLPGNKEYMKHHKWKMEMYESVGIVPWKNLIVTYDDPDGNINLGIIESEIRNKLL